MLFTPLRSHDTVGILLLKGYPAVFCSSVSKRRGSESRGISMLFATFRSLDTSAVVVFMVSMLFATCLLLDDSEYSSCFEFHAVSVSMDICVCYHIETVICLQV